MDGRRGVAITVLLLQGIGALAWWGVLFAVPAARRYFLSDSSNDASLMAFAVGDLFLFAAGSLLSAMGIYRRSRWTWTVLCIHAGAGMYAALYCITLTAITHGGSWAGAAGMTPSLIALPVILWMLRPGAKPE